MPCTDFFKGTLVPECHRPTARTGGSRCLPVPLFLDFWAESCSRGNPRCTWPQGDFYGDKRTTIGRSRPNTLGVLLQYSCCNLLELGASLITAYQMCGTLESLLACGPVFLWTGSCNRLSLWSSGSGGVAGACVNMCLPVGEPGVDRVWWPSIAHKCNAGCAITSVNIQYKIYILSDYRRVFYF